MTRPGVDIAAWKQRQETLRAQVRVEPLAEIPRFVAGVDCAFSRDKKNVLCVALVWDREQQRVVDESRIVQPVTVPYIPGFLSFREGPAVKAAVGGLRHEFGVVMFDGQGIAHPRRCGLATHMGVELDVISVGAAKNRLIGTHDNPGPNRGQAAPLWDKKERIGSVLRTRDGVRPLYISIGHRIDLPSAEALVLACGTRYRLPEPTRLADRAVAELKRSRS